MIAAANRHGCVRYLGKLQGSGIFLREAFDHPLSGCIVFLSVDCQAQGRAGSGTDGIYRWSPDRRARKYAVMPTPPA